MKKILLILPIFLLFSCNNDTSNVDVEIAKVKSTTNSCINTLEEKQEEIEKLKSEIKWLNEEIEGLSITIKDLDFVIEGLEKNLYEESEKEQ